MEVNGAELPDMIATYAVSVRWRQHWQLLGPGLMSLGAATAIVASFRPWVRSGTTGRSSYDLLGLVHRLGFAPEGPVRWAVRAWPLMPLLATVAVVAVWWGWRALGVVFGLLAGLYAGVLGAVLTSAAPDTRALIVSRAPLVTAIGAGLLVLGSVVCACVRVPSEHANTS